MITFSNLKKAAWDERNSSELTRQVTLGKACNLSWPECQGHGEGEAGRMSSPAQLPHLKTRGAGFDNVF